MKKEDVINALLEEAEKFRESLVVGTHLRRDTSDIASAIESNHKAIAEIAKTLEK